MKEKMKRYKRTYINEGCIDVIRSWSIVLKRESHTRMVICETREQLMTRWTDIGLYGRRQNKLPVSVS